MPDRAPLVSSFDPSDGSEPAPADRVERGAMAIYGDIIRCEDPLELRRKWTKVAKETTRERHRREAEACLRAAG